MKVKTRYRWVIFGLCLLFIPAVNVLDVFPDFIAYFILAGVLSHGVNKLPYFEEARTAFIKLGFINLCRVIAIVLILRIRAINYDDTDIYAMMTLLFGIVESIYLFPAISNLFDALFYLGQRSDSQAILAPVRLIGRKISTDTIKNLTYFFAGARAVLALLPELCYMSGTSKTGTAIITHPYAHLYPLVLAICFTLSLIIGIVWLVATAKYSRAIGRENLYYTSIDALVTEDRRPEIENKVKLRRSCSALNIMMLASLFTLEINFDNFGDLNILPHFIFAILLVSGLRHLTSKTKYTTVASLVTIGYTAVSLVGHGLLIAFFEKWESYTEIKRIPAAAQEYDLIKALSVVEFVFAAALIITVMLALKSFVENHTKIAPNAEGYGIPDRDFHRSLFRKNIIYTAFGILATASKAVQVFLNGGSDYEHVDSALGDITSIQVTALPWFGLAMTVLALLYTGSALYFFGILKDELKMKYQ